MDPVLPVWVSPLAVALVVVTTTALAVYVSLPLLRQPSGPTLPERLQRWRGQHRFGMAAAFATMVFAGWHALWGIPLAWLAFTAVSHRVRRRVFGDTWSLAGQAAWNLRVFAAALGFWWAVSLAPLLLVSVGAAPWLMALTGAALLASNHFYAELLLPLIGARVLDRPELAAAFAPVLARATVPRPRLLHAGPRGAVIANAFAISSRRGDAVLFFDSLLERATPAEAAGVLAHEVGHLEDFATRRGRLYAHGALLAIGAALVPLVVWWTDGAVPSWITLIWFGVAMGSLVARAVRSQPRETASDLRAVELCGGDGEALIRALVLLYETAQAPRRLDPEEERHSTHPGLGRRIRAIRAATGVAPAAIEPRAIRGDGVPRAVIFEAERLVFVTADAPMDVADPVGLVLRAQQVDAIPYAELSDLRVEAGRTLPAVLVAADRAGVTRRLRIAVGDVPAVQALMDLVEQRMSPVPAPPIGRTLAPVLGRITSTVALFALLVPTPAFGILGAVLLACIKPTATLLGAVAAGALATLVAPGAPPSPMRVLALTLTAFACLGVVAMDRRAERSRAQPFAWHGFLVLELAIVGGVALLFAWCFLALGYGDVVRLHDVARAFPSAAASFAALGGLLLVVPRRLARVASVVAFAAAGSALWLGSSAFRDRYAPDPLIAAAPPLVVDDLTAPVVERLTMSGSHWNLHLSPDARHLIAAAMPTGYGQTIRYDVAGFDGWQRGIDAQDVAFLDADTLFVVRTDGRARVLSTEGVRDGVVRWSLRLDDAGPGGVEVEATGRWRIVELNAGTDGTRVRLEGRIGEATVHPPTGTRLALERRWTGGINPFAWMVPELMHTTNLARAAGTAPRTSIARTRLDLDCRGTPGAPSAVTCLARTGSETYVWDLDVEQSRLTPIAWIPEALTATGADARVIVVWRDREILALWRGVPRAVRLARRDVDCPCPYDASYANGRLATMTRDGNIVPIFITVPQTFSRCEKLAAVPRGWWPSAETRDFGGAAASCRDTRRKQACALQKAALECGSPSAKLASPGSTPPGWRHRLILGSEELEHAVPRVVDVPGHRFAGLDWIVSFKSLHDFVMHDPAGVLLGSQDIQSPDMLERKLELVVDAPVPGRGGYGQVELFVRFDQLVQSELRALLDFDGRRNGDQVVHRSDLSCLFGGVAFKQLPELVQLDDFPYRQRRHNVPLVADLRDPPLLAQTIAGLPDGRAAGLAKAGQLDLDEEIPRKNLASEDRILDNPVDPIDLAFFLGLLSQHLHRGPVEIRNTSHSKELPWECASLLAPSLAAACCRAAHNQATCDGSLDCYA